MELAAAMQLFISMLASTRNISYCLRLTYGEKFFMKENLLGSPGPGTPVLIIEKETDIAQDRYLGVLTISLENWRKRK